MLFQERGSTRLACDKIKRRNGTMERVYYLQNKGKDILFIDYSNLKANEIVDVIKQAKEQLISRPKNSVLTLTNFEGARFNSDTLNHFKQQSLETKEYVKTGAVVGITGLQKIAYDVVSKFSKINLPLFGSREEALDWLVTQ